MGPFCFCFSLENDVIIGHWVRIHETPKNAMEMANGWGSDPPSRPGFESEWRQRNELLLLLLRRKMNKQNKITEYYWVSIFLVNSVIYWLIKDNCREIYYNCSLWLYIILIPLFDNQPFVGCVAFVMPFNFIWISIMGVGDETLWKL